MESQDSKKPVVFIHIPKTAGTTFYDAIKWQYRRREIFTVKGAIGRSGPEVEKLSDKRKSEIKFYKGHMSYGLHRFLDSPCTYISILREPSKRMISLFYYLKQSPTHRRHHLTEGRNLDEFIDECDFHHNYQAKFLLGREYHSMESDDEKLEAAKNRIEKNFAVVGIQERFDESLILLKEHLGWNRFPLYVRQNKSQNSGSRRSIDQATLEKIRKLNYLDVEIYRYAEKRFEEQVSALGDRFVSEVERFKKLNRMFYPFGRVYSGARNLALKFAK